ncbi:hypothetical protein G6F57_015625 [Rhizopus arrhizus]|uniref:Uncharacterized protein n=1 Tax=Rhizopus oryzae TaxID=64495 RepID=A0A9P7BJ01_RHIOR|nr:hypothetical protein G6F65_023159 [Rhizopus arrhizus]KAG1275165.1 hypothetical protein G6F64_014956 [Rhizopus arrhizus]KAG1453896.1 hypothetical protein G6F57_015625 [Rhizopus arrhizus]
MGQEVVLDLHQHPIHPTLAAPARRRAGTGMPAGAGVANFSQRLGADALDVARKIDVEESRHIALAHVLTLLRCQPVITSPIEEAAH